MAEVQQPKFKTDENGDEVPDVRAEAAIIYNPQTGAVLYESNAQNQRSIASITKVMTAVVFMEGSPDLDQKVKVVRAIRRAGGIHHVSAGRRIPSRPAICCT